MRLQESIFIGNVLKNYHADQKKFEYVINLGSGNVKQLRQNKPWINEYVFAYLKKINTKILHVDTEKFPGVDIIQDLSLPNSLSFCDKLNGSKLFILANVMEHIPKSAHKPFLKKIYKKMNSNDGLIISVPYDYPYHADPIDNMYRPRPNDLKVLLPLKWKASEIINAGSYWEEFINMNTFKKIRKLLKPIWIFQTPKKYLENHRLLYLFKNYQITIVFGIK